MEAKTFKNKKRKRKSPSVKPLAQLMQNFRYNQSTHGDKSLLTKTSVKWFQRKIFLNPSIPYGCQTM